MPTAKKAKAMSTINATISEIELAAATQNRVFAIYVLFLIAGALVTAALTIWLWRATSGYQDAVKRDADSRIVTLETNLSKQRELAAKAERDLLELQERLKPRTLSAEQRRTLVATLRRARKGPVEIARLMGDSEASAFGTQLNEALEASGWRTGGLSTVLPGEDVTGVVILISDAADPPAHTEAIEGALQSVGILSVRRTRPGVPEGTVRIWVGHKLSPPATPPGTASN
jgi:hypothetical protein